MSPTAQSIPFSSSWFSPFFTDWAKGKEVCSNFLQKPSPESLLSRAEHLLNAGNSGRPPDAFFNEWESYLRENNAGIRTLDNLELLENREAGLVITGQQPGILGGPLYNFYKASTACSLAHHLTEQNIPAVPVFWNHSDDHDLSEIETIRVLDAKNNISEISLDLTPDLQGEIRSLNLPDKSRNVVEQCRNKLRDTEFKEQILSLLETTRSDRPAEWFTRILLEMYKEQGLLVFEPFLGRKYWVGSLKNHLENWNDDVQALKTTGQKLRESGYEKPLSLREGPDLFRITNGNREPVDPEEKSLDAWTSELQEHPTRFSPGVALRVLVQDSFFPVLTSVCGPGEISYLAQLHPLYKKYEVSRPAILPRLSMTVVEKKVRKVMGKFDINRDNLFQLHDRKDKLLDSVLPPEANQLFDEFNSDLNQLLNRLKEKTVSINSNLEDPWDKTREQITSALNIYRNKVEETLRKEEKVGTEQLEKLFENLFPNRNLQERMISPWHYLTLYGPELMDKINRVSSEFLQDPYSHRILVP